MSQISATILFLNNILIKKRVYTASAEFVFFVYTDRTNLLSIQTVHCSLIKAEVENCPVKYTTFTTPPATAIPSI